MPIEGEGSSAECSIEEGGTPWSTQLVAQPQVILETAEVTVRGVRYPRPDYDGKPWSQWGQGLVAEDGRFFSAIGDHHGVDGNSFVYVYDPASSELTLIADVNEIVGQQPGEWGFGKVHAQMVAGPCGVYVATYWGTRRGLTYTDQYRGDHLLVVDPDSETIHDLSVVLAEHGVPSMASDPATGLIYAEAIDPFVSPNSGSFVVLDGAGETRLISDVPHTGFRAMAVDTAGRAYFSSGDGTLARYDPATDAIDMLDIRLPGDMLRAATPPGPDGTIYGVTRTPSEFFALSPDGHVESLGSARGYTTTLALDSSGSTIYSIPYAHGGAGKRGAPLIAVDTETGEERVVAMLNDAAEEHLGLTLGGTYNMAIDGDRLYIGMNAGEIGGRSAFGEVVLLIVDLHR